MMNDKSRLIGDVLIRQYDGEGYTHDLAAAILRLDEALSARYHIVADGRGFGPLQVKWRYRSALTILQQLAQYGDEQLRFLPDGGVEFYPIPAAERIDMVAEIKKILDANKE